MTTEVLSAAQAAKRLSAELPQWQLCEDDSIERSYKTSGWKSSMMIASAIGYLAETVWHHPRIVIEYSSVKVNLTTHSEGGVTEKDLALAVQIDELVLNQSQDGSMGKPPAKHALLAD